MAPLLTISATPLISMALDTTLIPPTIKIVDQRIALYSLCSLIHLVKTITRAPIVATRYIGNAGLLIDIVTNTTSRIIRQIIPFTLLKFLSSL